MVITKDDLAPPPYSAQPAAEHAKPAQPAQAQAQALAVQSSQYPQASSSTAGSSAGPLLPTHAHHAHAHAQRLSDTSADILAGRLARHRFLVAFLWAILIWLIAGLILGGAGAMDYGRHPGHGRDGRRH